MRELHYYFWINSDWAYLGADRLESLARRHGLTIRYKPVDLIAVGSPTYLFDGERFWGQDRLDFLEEAVQARVRA